MNGVHDLGGMHGFPDLGYERDEPVFHHEWERRCFALNFAVDSLGRWNSDTWRHAAERMDPHEYLTTSYYEHWLHAMETLLVQHGLLTREELEARLAGDFTPVAPAPGRPAALAAAEVEAALLHGAPAARDVERPARFRPGDRVRTVNMHPEGHTRGCPATPGRNAGHRARRARRAPLPRPACGRPRTTPRSDSTASSSARP